MVLIAVWDNYVKIWLMCYIPQITALTDDTSRQVYSWRGRKKIWIHCSYQLLECKIVSSPQITSDSFQVKQMFQSSNIDTEGNLDYKSLCYIITHGEEQEEWRICKYHVIINVSGSVNIINKVLVQVLPFQKHGKCCCFFTFHWCEWLQHQNTK